MFILLGYWEAITFKGQKSFGYLVNLIKTDAKEIAGLL